MKEFDFEKIPIVEIANEILLDGVKKGASDIHFDPGKDDLKIRMRVDGTLYDYTIVPGEYKRNMVSRIKMIASMNIMETRLPQDGAIKSKIGDKMLDLRVSSLPTNCGEKVVLRILDFSRSSQGLETLGFSEVNLQKILRMIEIPNGIVLVTGATGSGKSTTVYSILSRLNTSEVNIITVEDPVEMDVVGINQVQAQHEIGLDFATVLKSILRQDPDIIMIGEIRDGETAKIAVRASITGHKVLSTIHTNSALNTIERLTDMDVERYLISTSLNGCISQKLARKMCPHCRVQRETSDYEKKLINLALGIDVSHIYDINPKGCEHCMHGYKGRICVAEVLLISDEVKTAITNNAPKEEMRRMVYGHSDTHTLLQDGLEKVVLGETNFEEILKLVDLENDIAIHEDLRAQGIAQAPFDLEAALAKQQAKNTTPVEAQAVAIPDQTVAQQPVVQETQPVAQEAQPAVQETQQVVTQEAQPVQVAEQAVVQEIQPTPVVEQQVIQEQQIQPALVAVQEAQPVQVVEQPVQPVQVVEQPAQPVQQVTQEQYTQPNELGIPTQDAVQVQQVDQVLVPPAAPTPQVVPSMVAATDFVEINQ